MIVVADTSPLNYLVQLGCADVLPKLFGKIVVPASVHRELISADAPSSVSLWASTPKPWVIHAEPVTKFPDASPLLDAGEREAIQLACNMGAHLLLIDERMGAAEATRLSIPFTGTLGVILLAGKGGILDAREQFERLLETTNFRCSDELQRSFRRDLADAGI